MPQLPLINMVNKFIQLILNFEGKINDARKFYETYTSYHFIDVDGTIPINLKCTYISSGMNIIKIKIGLEIYPCNPYCIVFISARHIMRT